MAEILNLTAHPRPHIGKSGARALRRQGRVPAIIYGDTTPPSDISIALNEITKLYATGRIMTTLIDLDIDGKKQRAIARDVQLHPVKDTILHADFLRLGQDARIAVEVPVVFINEDISPGLKSGGVLNIVRHAIELSCPAEAIPESIVLDLAEAQMNDSLHISQMKLPENVTPVITDRDFTVATIAAPAALRSEAEEAELEAEEAEEAAEAAEGAEQQEGDDE